MNPYELFATDTKAEKEGVILDYGAFNIRIARAGGANKKFARVLDAKMKPHSRSLQTGTMDEAVASKLLAEAYAEAVVLGWDGVSDKDGNPLEFTRENAVKLFLDLPDLFTDIQANANRVANFRTAEVEEAKGNS